MSTTLLQIRVAGQPQLEAKIGALKAALDSRRILDEGAAVLFNRVRTRFLAETDPDGHRWPPSLASLARKQSGRGGGTLFDTGDLFRSLQLFADSDTSRAIGTNVSSPSGFPYPMIHNFGLAGFPERQFLGFGKEDVAIMTRVIIRLISKALGL